jgi:hypothetical protein
VRFHIIRDSRFIYHVMADDVRVGELSQERGVWQFHYTAQWINPANNAEEVELWKLINDQKMILNVTSRLKA